MDDLSPQSDDDALLALQAEEVRTYLVSVRAGAPFLSGPDGRLLLKWLEGGVPVAAILAAIDRVAARRRKKRARSRLTLVACKGEVNKSVSQASEVPSPTETTAGLATLAARFREMETHAHLAPLQAALVARLEELGVEGLDPAAQVSAAITACRLFQEGVWSSCEAEHPALMATAAEELAPLKGAVSAAMFDDLVAEVARDRLRQRFPIVCAQVVWDTLAAP